jgi:acetyl-CoA carboxylase carboxyl transferase subunit alpha
VSAIITGIMMILIPGYPRHRARNSHQPHAIYSVISPEAASSILWRDGTKAGSRHQHEDHSPGLGPLRHHRFDSAGAPGGAHRDPAAMTATTGNAIAQALNDLRNLTPDMVRQARRQKFPDIGRKLG